MHYSSVLKMDRSEETRTIRQYRKSLLPRLRWTPELHRHFVQAVHSLGGKNKATPKKIMQIMGVKGLKISHIKSHLQMYRSMRESMISNDFISIKNYQEKRRNSRQVYPRLGEAPSHGKLVRVPLTCQIGRITQKDKVVLYRGNQQGQGAQGSSTSEITKGSAEDPGAKLEVRGISEINFLGLGNDQSSDSINLDLTISSH